MDEKFLVWNRAGLIPGPMENEDQYLKRVEYCLNLNQEIASKLPFREEDRGNQSIFSPSFARTRELYDIEADWVPLFFSDYQLVLWHGGCAWIFQVDEESPTAAVLQLRQAFKNSTKYIGMYKRDELIAHEVAHIGRMMFEEPIFEEFHAYRSSDSWFRRCFGPLIQSAKESIFFVLSLIFIFILDVSLIALQKHALYDWAMWIKAVPLLLLAAALGRLTLRHRQYDRCLEVLYGILGDRQKANAVIFRLTDKEIVDIGKMDSKQILNFVKEQQGRSLRWRVIAEAYFNGRE